VTVKPIERCGGGKTTAALRAGTAIKWMPKERTKNLGSRGIMRGGRKICCYLGGVRPMRGFPLNRDQLVVC